MQYAVGVGAKRSTHTVHVANMGGGTVTFGAKRLNPMQLGMQYAVGVGAKRSTHTLYLANICAGDHYL